MTTETILTKQAIISIQHNYPSLVPLFESMWKDDLEYFARAIEQAVLQSPEMLELKKDAERLDKLEQDYFEPVEGGIRKHIDYQIEVDAETFGPKSKLKLVVSR